MPQPLSAPIGLLAELTHRCPLHCPYCSNPLELERRSDEMDVATWSRVFREAAGQRFHPRCHVGRERCGGDERGHAFGLRPARRGVDGKTQRVGGAMARIEGSGGVARRRRGVHQVRSHLRGMLDDSPRRSIASLHFRS